jgi:hypothetical protein
VGEGKFESRCQDVHQEAGRRRVGDAIRGTLPLPPRRHPTRDSVDPEPLFITRRDE